MRLSGSTVCACVCQGESVCETVCAKILYSPGMRLWLHNLLCPGSSNMGEIEIHQQLLTRLSAINILYTYVYFPLTDFHPDQQERGHDGDVGADGACASALWSVGI